MEKDRGITITNIDAKKQCNISGVTQRTYRCFDCKNYDVKTGKVRGSVDRICSAIKNDSRIIVDLDAPDCNDYVYVGKQLNK